MKQADLKPCALCNKGVLADRNIAFYRIRVTNFVADMGAINRQVGLEMLVGNPTIANVMGPDDDIAIPFSEGDCLVCMTCATTKHIGELIEIQP